MAVVDPRAGAVLGARATLVTWAGRHHGAKLVVLAVAALSWLVVNAGPAWAHADLTSTEPAAGAVLERAPTEIVLAFSEGVDPVAGGIHLVREDGVEVERFELDHHQGSVLRVQLVGSLQPATYVVAWRAVSADSHPIRGAFVFHVGTKGGTDTSALVNRLLSDQGGTSGTGALLAVGRWLSYFGALLSIGALSLIMTALVGVPRRRATTTAVTSPGLGTVAGWAGAVGAVGAAVMMAAQAASVTGSWSALIDPAALADVAATRAGRWWAVRLVVLVATAVLLGWGAWRGRRSALPDGSPAGSIDRPLGDEQPLWLSTGPARVGAGVLAGGLALITAMGGHAVSGRWVALGIGATVVHLWALGFWLSGLILLLGRHRWGPGSDGGAWDLALRFSPLALVAVLAVLGTGVFSSLRQVGEASLLTSTLYGRVLLAKVALVAVLIGVAWLSRRSLRAGEAGGGRALRRTVGAEAVLYATVLVASAVLVNIRPAYSQRSEPASGSAVVGQRLAQVVLEPARAGTNSLHVYLSSPGGALDRADPITVSATLPEADLGPFDVTVFPAGPNHVTNPAIEVPLKGRWTFEVVARYGRFEEVRFAVPLVVGG